MIMNQSAFKEEKGFQLGLEAKHGSKPGGELLGRVSKKRDSRSFGLELGRNVMLTEHLTRCHMPHSLFHLLVIRSRCCYSCLKEREFLFYKEKS